MPQVEETHNLLLRFLIHPFVLRVSLSVHTITMSAVFSHPFVDQRPTYLNRGSSLPYGLSPSSGYSENRPNTHSNRLHSGSDPLAHTVPFLLYPTTMDPGGLYEASFRGPGGPNLLPYLSPFHHGHFGVYECPFEPAFIQKRNERERQRVKCVNQGYAKLRDHLPGGVSEKRLSKVETLRAAINYIKYLQGLLEGQGKGRDGYEGGQVCHSPSSVHCRTEDSDHSNGGSPHSLSDSSSSSAGIDCEESAGSGT
ncbi:achaete-scute homolog 5-like [Oncorhynchus keta]|uniref:achaete-scute homolog 5-like n=1 Tax=Oncorhynchus keta TaxID=8018 RepID=UPI0015FBE8FE|nr:achaete-scute homolog 5-like [Oncorhynchus keta]XP_035634263.1 achaete-scute homolog 5-like [Oncorhynchus keta]